MILSRMPHLIQGKLLRAVCALTSNRSSAALAAMQERYIFSATSPRLEKKTFKVPTMGDSITEGTIVEWTAAVGQAVKEGDVVALVETDKVTVDIKAELDGVIVEQFGAVDDTVEVGANLYIIDTETEGKVVPQAPYKDEPTVAAPAAEKEIVVLAAEASSQIHRRNPSIHFLGKSGWAERLSGHKETVSSDVIAPSSPTAVVSVQSDIHPMYGRPAFTEIEMEALIMGGAETAPSVVLPSGGARFAA